MQFYVRKCSMMEFVKIKNRISEKYKLGKKNIKHVGSEKS